MRMKFLQGLADIYQHYNDIIFYFDVPWGKTLLETWDIDYQNEQVITEIKEEKEALRFLIGCSNEIVHDESAQKPSKKVIERCFKRHLSFLKTIHKIDETNVRQHDHPFVKREFKTCRHYLFQVTLKAWYERLPDTIQTLEEKFNDIRI